MRYGWAVKVLRKINRMSQRKLAGASHVTPSSVSYIESGKRIPSLPVLERLAKALDVDVPYLVLVSASEEDINGRLSPGYDYAIERLKQDLLNASDSQAMDLFKEPS
jgi:transcriptional regulator with XRE-family HTH domain